MTRDEIIAMANTAAVQHGHTYEPEAADGTIEFLGSFAALVAANEREACAQVAEDEDHEVSVRGYYAQLGDARATMRNIAAAIRARGTKEGA